MAIRALALELSPFEGPPPGGPSAFIRTKISNKKLLIRSGTRASNADEHLESAAENDHLRTGEASRAEPADSADNGAESGAFAAAKNSAEQRASTSTESRVNERFFTASARFDRAFYVDRFAGWRMVELDDFCRNRRAATVGHHQPVEGENHSGVAAKFPRIVDVLNRAVNARALVDASVEDGSAEGIANDRISRCKRVVHADAKGGPLRDGEG